MSFESFKQILEFAAGKEKEAVLFYEDLAKQAHQTGARETLQGFAKEEKKHQTLLENMVKNKGKISDYQFKWVPDMKRSNYLIDVELEKGLGYADLLRLAMKREEKSLKLYNELMDQVEIDDLAQVFKMLAQEEATHKLKLETLYDDYMAAQGD